MWVLIKSNRITSATHSSLGKRGTSFEKDLKYIPIRSFLVYGIFWEKKWEMRFLDQVKWDIE